MTTNSKVKPPKMCVVIRTQFEAIHRWATAPNEVDFLRSPHRHVFHVELRVKVTHTNRDIEFILLKRCVDDYLAQLQPEHTLEWSCERYASELMGLRFTTTHNGVVTITNEANVPHVCAHYVAVFEDGENGSIVQR